MTSRYLFESVWLASCALAVAAPVNAGPTIFRILAEMNQYSPPMGLTEVSPGLFYFPSGSSLFSITTHGTTTLLEPLPIGALSPLVAGANGQFYSSSWGGYNGYYPYPGNVFSVAATGETVHVYAPQTLAPTLMQNLPDGSFLAVASNIFSDAGSLVESDLNGNVTPIYNFALPEAAVAAVYAPDGNYYVVTWANRDGFVYRVTPSGSRTTIATLKGAFFSGYTAALLLGSDGNLYGTTPLGGAHGTGSVYKLTLDGQYTLLYSFGKTPNSYPTNLMEASDGNLYGATEGYLSPTLLFQLTKSGQYTQLFEMPKYRGCPCELTQGSDGILYGAAQGGYIFALYAGLPPPPPRAQAFMPQSGPVGTTVLLWGWNMLAASVAFNGTPAAVVSSGGSNYVTVTVPPGATTGPITVTTSNGTSTTRANFVVN